MARADKLKAPGTIVRARVVDAASPIAYGYPDAFSIYTADGPIFNLSNIAGGRGRRRGRRRRRNAPTGRGTADDPDRPQGRPFVEPPEEPEAETWEALPLTEEQRRNPIYVIPPAQRPRTVLRYADAKDLLVSGLLEGGERDRGASGGGGRARGEGPRRAVLEQPDLARARPWGATSWCSTRS